MAYYCNNCDNMVGRPEERKDMTATEVEERQKNIKMPEMAFGLEVEKLEKMMEEMANMPSAGPPVRQPGEKGTYERQRIANVAS